MAEEVKKGLFQDENRRRRAWDAIDDLVEEAHDNAMDHGFYKNVADTIYAVPLTLFGPVKGDFVLAQLAKIASEVGEAVAVVQKQGIDAFDLKVELADILIRVFDLVGFLPEKNVFPQAILGKMEYNRTRPYLHGKNC